MNFSQSRKAAKFISLLLRLSDFARLISFSKLKIKTYNYIQIGLLAFHNNPYYYN
ncbi:hypothetical protein C8C83_4320 [Flavobacterium sp. 90]|nr:hypothetical protein C8C82_4656 [Flavobacterium sp. 81]TCK56307.1 hypothetical protein C8C83_4320 [Flavobacterium sp. 90]